MRRVVGLILVVGLAGPVMADQFDLNAALGVGRIVSVADRCGIKINDDAMDAYMKKAGIDKPEALSIISLKVSTDKTSKEPVTDAECSVVKATARSMGVTE